MHSNNAQCELILRHIRERPITPIEALDVYGCFRLGARIWELKQRGHQIVTERWNTNGKTVARYRLATNEKRPVGEVQPGALQQQRGS